MKVLSIDAWGNKADGYEWNAWYSVGEIDKATLETLTTDKAIATWFKENGFTTSDDMRRIIVEDDGYNIVICDKATRQPLFAIEYGPEM